MTGVTVQLTVHFHKNRVYQPSRKPKEYDARGQWYGHKQVNLVQYRRPDGRWQFVPAARRNGKPDPQLVLINAEPTNNKGGHFYIAWREEGGIKRKAVGSSPREALDAWHLRVGILSREIEPEPEPETAETKTIDAAIAEYLRASCIGRLFRCEAEESTEEASRRPQNHNAGALLSAAPVAQVPRVYQKGSLGLKKQLR